MMKQILFLFVLSHSFIPAAISAVYYDYVAEYLYSNSSARDQIFSLQVGQEDTHILSTSLTVGQAVSHMIETQDASWAEVQKGIDLLEIFVLPPLSSLDHPSEMYLRTKMRVNRDFTIRLYLIYNLVSLMETYKEDYPGLIHSALLNLPLIARYDRHPANRRLATLAYVSLQKDPSISYQLLHHVFKKDGEYIFDYKYNPEQPYSAIKSTLNNQDEIATLQEFKQWPFPSLSQKVENLDNSLLLDNILALPHIMDNLDNSPLLSDLESHQALSQTLRIPKELALEFFQKEERALAKVNTEIEALLNKLKNPSTVISQKYYKIEVENILLYNRMCSSSDHYTFCTLEERRVRERRLDSIISSGLPLETIQIMQRAFKETTKNGQYYKTLKTFVDDTPISYSQINRQFAKAILHRLVENKDISFNTLLKIAIEEYSLPNLLDKRSYANPYLDNRAYTN